MEDARLGVVEGGVFSKNARRPAISDHDGRG